LQWGQQAPHRELGDPVNAVYSPVESGAKPELPSVLNIIVKLA